MATIKKYKLKNGNIKYQANVFLKYDEKTGKQVNFFKRGFSSKKEAELYVKRIQLKVADGNYHKQDVDIKTFKDLYELWLENDYKQREIKPSTIATNERNFRIHILPVFGDYRIKKITAKDVYKAVKRWNDESLAKANVFKNFVSNILQFGVINNYLDANVASGIKVPRHEHKINRDTIANYYDEKELNEFLKLIKLDWKTRQPYVFFCLLAYIGMRKGEAFALTWQDIDFKNNTIDINKTVSKVNNMLVI